MGICERQHDLSANEKAIIERYRVAVYYCDNGYNIGAVISPEDQVKSVFKAMKANPHWKTSSILASMTCFQRFFLKGAPASN